MISYCQRSQERGETLLMTLRLQLGAGRFENMDPTIVHFFADRSWIHLGDRSSRPTPILDKLKGKSFRFLISIAFSKLRKMRRNWQSGEQLSSAYELTDFRSFTYAAGDTLPFADESFDFTTVRLKVQQNQLVAGIV